MVSVSKIQETPTRSKAKYTLKEIYFIYKNLASQVSDLLNPADFSSF